MDDFIGIVVSVPVIILLCGLVAIALRSAWLDFVKIWRSMGQ